LQEYLLVAQDATRIDHFVRQADNRWLFASIAAMEAALCLPSLECSLPLSDVYRTVAFPQ
jgi:hypothetical protein